MNRRKFLTGGASAAALMVGGGTAIKTLFSPSKAMANANCAFPAAQKDPINDANFAKSIVSQAFDNLNLWHSLDKFAFAKIDLFKGRQDYKVSELSDFSASWITTYLGVVAAERSRDRASAQFAGRALSTINDVFGNSTYNDILSQSYYNLDVDPLQVEKAVKAVDRDRRIPTDFKPAVKEGLKNGSWVYLTVEMLKAQAEQYPKTRKAIVDRLYDKNGNIPFLDLADCRKPNYERKRENKPKGFKFDKA